MFQSAWEIAFDFKVHRLTMNPRWEKERVMSQTLLSIASFVRQPYPLNYRICLVIVLQQLQPQHVMATACWMKYTLTHTQTKEEK